MDIPPPKCDHCNSVTQFVTRLLDATKGIEYALFKCTACASQKVIALK
jgi:glutaredoxin